MVDLPSIPNRLITPQAPQSRVSAGQVASPYLELADTLNTASKEVGEYANREAEKEGLKSVTRDDAGNVRVEKPFIVGDAALHYQHGVEVAAVADGENVIRTDMLKMRHEHQDDPAGFQTAAKAYTQEKVKQYQTAAGPRVGVTLGRIANDTAREFHEGLLNQKERRDIANAKTSIEAQIKITENEIYAIAAGGDTESPNYTQRLEKIGALYNQLSSNPKFGVPAAVVDYEMSRLKSELSVSTMGYRLGEIQKTQGTEAALAAADKIRTDPGLNLTPTERFGLHSRLVGGIMQQNRAEEAISKRVGQEIDQVMDSAADGYSAPPQQMAALRQKVLETGNPALAAKLRDVEAVAPIVATWKKSSPQQLEQTLASLEGTMRKDGATPALRELLKTGRELLKNMRDGIKTDMLDWSNRTGSMPVAPIEWGGGHANIATQFRDRVAVAESIARDNGAPPQYLFQDEKAQISQLASAGGQPMLDVARAVVEGAGSKAGKVLSEISKDSPVLAHIGGLMQSGGSPSLIRDAADAVKLAANPEFKHPTWLGKESDAIQAAHNERKVSIYGGAFFGESETERAAEQTAQKAFFTRAMRNGYDPKFSFGDMSGAKAAYDRTLQEAAGATFDPRGIQYGGTTSYKPGYWSNYRVLVPPNVRANSFSRVLGAIRDEDVKGAVSSSGKAYTAADIRSAIPVAGRNGYRFAVGDPTSDDPKWIRGADGKPFVLDLAGMEPVLRDRVAQAYSGGS